MTDEEISAAGAAVVKDWPPLTDEEVERLVVLLRTDDDVQAGAA